MEKSLQRLGGREKSTAFRWVNERATGTLTALNGEYSARCSILLNWVPGKPPQVTCTGTSDDLVPFAKTGIAQASLRAALVDVPWLGWTLECSSLDSGRSKKHEDYIKGERRVEIMYHQSSQASIVITRPAADKIESESDAVVYWLQNFVPDMGGFDFSASGLTFSVHRVEDVKDVKEQLHEGNINYAVASKMTVRGAVTADPVQLDRVVACAISFLSAMCGAWVTPFAYGRYAHDGSLQKLIFPSAPSYPYHATRRFMSAYRVSNGWSKLLSSALPQFIELHDRLALRSVCRQLIEAQYRLTVESQIAILLMCCEQICTRYLKHQGEVIRNNTPLKTKADMCNRTLRCLPRKFRTSLDEVRTSLRNPLFHEGSTDEPDFNRLMEHRIELLNACVVLLAAICGYRGPLQIADLNCGERIVTVDDFSGD